MRIRWTVFAIGAFLAASFLVGASAEFIDNWGAAHRGVKFDIGVVGVCLVRAFALTLLNCMCLLFLPAVLLGMMLDRQTNDPFKADSGREVAGSRRRVLLASRAALVAGVAAMPSAIMFAIDSPGGSPVPMDQLLRWRLIAKSLLWGGATVSMAAAFLLFLLDHNHRRGRRKGVAPESGFIPNRDGTSGA